MEGKFFFRKAGDEIVKHEHVEFILDKDISFRYHDVRKFGKMYLIPKEMVDKVVSRYVKSDFKRKKMPIVIPTNFSILGTMEGSSMF